MHHQIAWRNQTRRIRRRLQIMGMRARRRKLFPRIKHLFGGFHKIPQPRFSKTEVSPCALHRSAPPCCSSRRGGARYRWIFSLCFHSAVSQKHLIHKKALANLAIKTSIAPAFHWLYDISSIPHIFLSFSISPSSDR